MADVLNPKQRKFCMSRIKGKNTKPEMVVRSLVHRMGYRYRLHDSKLPGKPDLVFKNRRKVVFVHGCFWHIHENCKYATMPKTRKRFWKEKLNANKKRDENNIKQLNRDGWDSMVIWECDLRKIDELGARVKDFLS